MRPLSLSRLAEGLWGERREACETVRVVREGGLLLTEEKCCGPASEDNCTEFVT